MGSLAVYIVLLWVSMIGPHLANRIVTVRSPMAFCSDVTAVPPKGVVCLYGEESSKWQGKRGHLAAKCGCVLMNTVRAKAIKQGEIT